MHQTPVMSPPILNRSVIPARTIHSAVELTKRSPQGEEAPWIWAMECDNILRHNEAARGSWRSQTRVQLFKNGIALDER